jgi:hypothetical protein
MVSLPILATTVMSNISSLMKELTRPDKKGTPNPIPLLFKTMGTATCTYRVLLMR